MNKYTALTRSQDLQFDINFNRSSNEFIVVGCSGSNYGKEFGRFHIADVCLALDKALSCSLSSHGLLDEIAKGNMRLGELDRATSQLNLETSRFQKRSFDQIAS